MLSRRSVKKKERRKEGERKRVSQKSKSLDRKEAGHWELSLLNGSGLFSMETNA